MINIAIDGPAGAGKSTIAKAVAKRLGIIYLDTGAMYRSVAYFMLKRGIDVTDEEKVGEALGELSMDIRYENGVQQIYVADENVTPYLREPHMSKAASDVSALPAVRYKWWNCKGSSPALTTWCWTAGTSAPLCCPTRAVSSS